MIDTTPSADVREARWASTPETPPMLDRSAVRYMVIRGDDNGQIFIVEEGLSLTDATARYDELIRGHKQWYLIVRYWPWERESVVKQYNLRV